MRSFLAAITRKILDRTSTVQLMFAIYIFLTYYANPKNCVMHISTVKTILHTDLFPIPFCSIPVLISKVVLHIQCCTRNLAEVVGKEFLLDGVLFSGPFLLTLPGKGWKETLKICNRNKKCKHTSINLQL